MMGYEHMLGQTLGGRYYLEKIIGIGGMAVVFKATDVEMSRHVALKLLKEEVAADESSVQRFINESKAVAMLSHPNIVSIFDVSMHEEHKYIVMEYIEGMTLKSYMNDRGQLPFREVLDYSGQILSALEHAHEKGIVHRDIKPQNIMLLSDGRIKVTDFGIAKLPNAETVTMTDKAIGTVFYISPEQASGKAIDSRSDIYSLGVMMYEMLGGRLPFVADNPVTVAMMQITASAAPVSTLNSSVPKGLEQAVNMAMAKDPAARFQSAADMIRVINALKNNPRVTFTKKAKIQKAPKKRTFVRARVNAQSHSMFPIVLGVLIPFLIVALVCGIVLMQKLTVDSSQNEYREVKVPKLVGNLFSDELADYLENSEIYTLESISYQFDESMPSGYILEQTPAAGSTKKVMNGSYKCAISLVISTGAETVTIPNYTIMDYRVVKPAITRLGLKFRVRWEDSQGIDYGYVIRTIPAAGETVLINSEITVVVSRGLPSPSIEVPSFMNYSHMRTLSLIYSYGFTLGSVTYAPSETVEEGLVISQSPEAGTMAAENTPINLILSSGPAGIPMPTVIGMNVDEALAMMSSLYNITNITTIFEYSQTAPENTIVRVWPWEGDRVYETTSITFYVSKGASVTLEDYTGRSGSEVRESLEALGLTVVWEELESDSVPAGTIMETIPGASTVLSVHDTVTLRVSRGSAVELEDYTGRSIDQVRPMLEAHGVIVSVETVEVAGQDVPGLILSMDRAAGDVLEPGETLLIRVTKGIEAHQVRVPSGLIGMHYEEAKALLEQAGLKAEISFLNIQDHPEGEVVLTSPSGGDLVDRGSTVTMVVSLGVSESGEETTDE